MSNDIALLSQAVFALRDNFTTVAVDRGINFDKEAGFALQILGSSDYMMSAAMNNRQSVENAITNVAAIGISLNPAKKQAYLVVRKNVVCLDISYMGLIDLAIASGSILWAQANIVREHDNFIVNGFDRPPTHGHDPFAGTEARGRIKGAYVVVKTPDGEYLTHTMDIDSIYSVRDRSEAWKSFKAGKAKSGGPWASDEGEMIKKTVVKQAYKYWPKTDRFNRVDQAIHHLNTEGGEGFEPISNGPKKYPADSLHEWITRANNAANEGELSTVWQQGVSAMKPSKDLEAYNAFKRVVAGRGDELKKQAVTDVTPKTNTPEVNAVQISARMGSAETEDELNEVAALINSLQNAHERESLNHLYDAALATIRNAL